MKFGKVVERPKMVVAPKPRFQPEPEQQEEPIEMDLNEEEAQSEEEEVIEVKAPIKRQESLQEPIVKKTLSDTDIALLIDNLRKDDDIALFEKAQMGAMKVNILRILMERLESKQKQQPK